MLSVADAFVVIFNKIYKSYAAVKVLKFVISKTTGTVLATTHLTGSADTVFEIPSITEQMVAVAGSNQ